MLKTLFSVNTEHHANKDNIYMQTGIKEVLRKCANSTISVVRMALYSLDCC